MASPRALARRAVVPVALAAALAGGRAHAEPARRPVEVVRLDDVVAGPFAGLDASAVRVEGKDPVAVDAVRELRFHPEPAPVPEGEGVDLRLVLRGGDVVPGRLASADAAGLEVVSPGLAPLDVPFDLLRRVEMDGPARGPCDGGSEPWRRPARAGVDVAWTRTGDAFAGTLDKADAEAVTIGAESGDRRVRWTDLAVLHVDEPEVRPPDGLVVEVDTSGGARFLAVEATSDGTTWRLRTTSGLEVAVPAARVRAARFHGGRFVRAGDLPFEATVTPWIPSAAGSKDQETWFRPAVDRTDLGCPLRVAGVPFAHGVWVHAKTELRVPLGKRFRRFDAWFGVADAPVPSEHGAGDVTARVVGDGRALWSSEGSVRGGQAPRRVGPLDVSGVETLVLEVDWGAEGEVLDRAVWGDPILVR